MTSGRTAKYFGAQLRLLRLRAGLRQRDLADASGVSKDTITDIECGYRAPRWETAVLLADTLGVSLDMFRCPVIIRIPTQSH